MKKDVGVLGLGKSDPYAVLEVGSKSGKTKVISNTITPEWFYTIDFPIEVVKGQQLTIEVFDHDDPGKLYRLLIFRRYIFLLSCSSKKCPRVFYQVVILGRFVAHFGNTFPVHDDDRRFLLKINNL